MKAGDSELVIRVDAAPLAAVEQYFGVWAMLEDTFRGLAEHVAGLDLVAHIQRQMTPQASAGRSAAVHADYELLDGVAVISLEGTLMKSVGSLSSGTSTIAARRQIRAAAANPDVKALLIRGDSPGGTTAGTADLAADIAAVAANKPIYGYAEDLAASACYWALSQCQKLFSNSTAVIGSIGTYSVVQDYSMAAAQRGVKVHVVRAGQHKGAGVPGTEITPEQLAEVQRVVNAVNDEFVRGVAAGRKMSFDQALKLADGRSHVGAAAQALGLIDGVQSFDETLAQLMAPMSPISNPTRRKGSPMSTETKDTPVAEVVTERAATFAELKAAFPKADAAFICAQLERSATLSQARTAESEHLRAQLEASQAEVTKLKGKGTTPPLPTGRGRKPGPEATVETEAAGGFEGDAKAEMSRLMGERMRAGMSRMNALKSVATAHPELHRAYLEQTNPPKTHAAIASRFEE